MLKCVIKIMAKYILKKIYKILRSPRLIVLTIFIFIIIIAGASVIYYWQIGGLKFYRRHHSLVQFIKKQSNTLYLPYLLSSSKLEHYDLIISKDDLEFLNQNLPPTYQGNSLERKYRKKIEGKLVVNDKEYQVKIRYHGDDDGHWRDSKKSWAITFSDKYFEGNKEIHLIIPVGRDYLLEELTFYRARKMGLLTTPTKFVNFFVNGQRQGVYWQFESWNKQMLEKRNVSADTNLYSGINIYELDDPSNYNYFEDVDFWRKCSYNTMQHPNDYTDLEFLLAIVNNPDDEYFNKNIGQIIDLENFYKWEINQYLVYSTHQDRNDLKFYFDSTQGKFKFIPWDISTGNIQSISSVENYYTSELIIRILKNPEFLSRRNELLRDYVNNPANLADDLKFYDELDKLTKNDFYKDFKKVESHLAYRKKINDFRNKIIESFNHVKSDLEVSQ